jgi:hypothetical protein
MLTVYPPTSRLSKEKNGGLEDRKVRGDQGTVARIEAEAVRVHPREVTITAIRRLGQAHAASTP